MQIFGRDLTAEEWAGGDLVIGIVVYENAETFCHLKTFNTRVC